MLGFSTLIVNSTKYAEVVQSGGGMKTAESFVDEAIPHGHIVVGSTVGMPIRGLAVNITTEQLAMLHLMSRANDRICDSLKRSLRRRRKWLAAGQ